MIYNKLETDDFILWNIIAFFGAILFIVLRTQDKTNLYEYVLAGFIGINGVTYAIGSMIFENWIIASLSLLVGISSFLILYLIDSSNREFKKT